MARKPRKKRSGMGSVSPDALFPHGKPRGKRAAPQDPGPGSLLGLIGTGSDHPLFDSPSERLLQPLHFKWSVDWRDYTFEGGAGTEGKAVEQAARALTQVFGSPPEIEYNFTDANQLFALYNVLLGGMAKDPQYPMRSPGRARLYVSLARAPGGYVPPTPLEEQDFGYFTMSRYAEENPRGKKKGARARRNPTYEVYYELWEGGVPVERKTSRFQTPDDFASWYFWRSRHPKTRLRIKRATLDGRDVDPSIVLGVAANNNPAPIIPPVVVQKALAHHAELTPSQRRVYGGWWDWERAGLKGKELVYTIVPCPSCGVEAGLPCVTKSWKEGCETA